ncbi:uncharacterized protein LOC117226816 [Megalopta genalis]|uniref:uncharacterized protein LOC117226816 n=1 Tax=Megalopta genalis TaxID=115081 RepID=UPI003FD39E12
MIVRVLLIFLLINLITCRVHQGRSYALNIALDQTTKRSEKLRSDYVMKDLNANAIAEIDKKISEHIMNKTKMKFGRYKREIFNRGINIIREFQDHSQLNFNNVKDIDFFSLQNDHQLLWFSVVLDALNISLYRIDNYVFYFEAAYPITRGRKIIVNCCEYKTLLIVHYQENSILVLRLTKEYRLYPIHDFKSSNMTDLAIWHGINQLYLGIVSDMNISIYIWVNDYFDLVQVIPYGAKKLIPFYNKGIMYLATTGPITLIFKYFFRHSEFAVTQRLPSSQDISSLRLEETHYMEQFLCLITDSSTILYKEVHDRFVPFQQIQFGRSASIFSNDAMLLLLLREDAILTYQYDGWRFKYSDVKLFGVDQFQQLVLHKKKLLLVKYKNSSWSIQEPKWVKQKSYKDLQEEIRTWNNNAKKATQRTILTENLVLKNPIKILNGYIDQLLIYNINDHNSEALSDATKEYKKLTNKLENQKISLNNKSHSDASPITFSNMGKLRVKCKAKCKVNHLNVKENSHLLSKLRKPSIKNQVQAFKALRTMEIENWKCPQFSFPIKKVEIGKLFNGKMLDDLEKNILKVVGDQKLSGKHTFSNVNVMNAFITLDIAVNITKQQLQMQQIETTEFHLMESGILLPLQGAPIIMTGTIQAIKIRVNGSVHPRGRIIGLRTLNPLIEIFESMNVDHLITLENAKIENLRSQDLIGHKIRSIKEILSNTIPLNSRVPATLALLNEKIKWNNVTLYGSQNWITINSQDTVTVSGRKHFPHNGGITLSFNNSKLPTIQTPVCSSTIIVPEVQATDLNVNNLNVKDLNSSHVFGNFGKRYLNENFMYTFKLLNLTTKTYHHNVTVKNLIATHLSNINITEILANSWTKSKILQGPIVTTDLAVDSLLSPIQIRIKLPKVVGDMISEKDMHIENINNVNFIDFERDAIKLENMISLGNITFGNGFAANNLYTNYLPFNKSQLKEHVNLYKKRISGSIETNAINLSHSFASFTENDVLLNVMVKDSVTFLTEPEIQSINDTKLKRLLGQLWMTENATVLQGRYLHITNVSIVGNIAINSISNILDLETWKNISKRVLSKTKPQEIQIVASLSDVETPGIIGSNISIIKSSVPDFNDMFDNALLHSKDQEITAKWTFNKLKIIGKLHAKNKINNMNLKTDVMRFDSEKALVAGKTNVMFLTAKNLNSLNFNDWAKNSLTGKQKSVIIKGRKIFNSITANNINVSDTAMGQILTGTLSKSTDQIVNGQKEIRGSVDAVTFVIDGLINDVDLIDLISNQLGKQKRLQSIKSRIELQKSLKILGNVTVNGSYGYIELNNFFKSYPSVLPVIEDMKDYSKAASTIKAALENRAVYLDKLEVVEERNVVDTVNKNITIHKKQSKFNNFLQYCINENIRNESPGLNSSGLVSAKLIVLGENEYIVCIKLHSVSIYLYAAKELYQLKALHIPNIIDAIVESLSESLWIILRLSLQTLLLHYQPWNNLQEYRLSATDVFQVSRLSNNQLLLLLSNGVWNLEGLASPQHIISIPLKENVETFINGFNYYVQWGTPNDTSLMKAQYIWN